MTTQEIDSKIYELRKRRDLYSRANFYHKVYEVNQQINKLRKKKRELSSHKLNSLGE